MSVWAGNAKAQKMNDDTPVDLTAPTFTHGEAVEITGISAKSLQNWLARGIISVGEMHRTGRRLYSVFDLVEITALYELTNMAMIPPGNAASIAAAVRKRCVGLNERNWRGQLKIPPNSAGAFRIQWFEGDRSKSLDATGWEWTKTNSLPHPFLIIPVDQIFTRIVKRAFSVLGRENKTDPIDEGDFFLEFDTDTEGRPVRVGLSYEETEEFERLTDQSMFQRSARRLPETEEQESARSARCSELYEKHDLARLQRLEATRKDRAP